MKKNNLLLVLCMFFFVTAQSQRDNFGQGNSAINVGIGFGNTIYSSYDFGFPSFSASYEYGVIEIDMGSSLKGVIGAGGIIGYGGANQDYGWGEVKNTFILVVARANYHFIFHEKFDPYAGMILGYYFGNSTVEYKPGSSYWDYNDDANGFHGGVYGGVRWFFTPGFAVFSELGWNISIFTIGATFKF